VWCTPSPYSGGPTGSDLKEKTVGKVRRSLGEVGFCLGKMLWGGKIYNVPGGARGVQPCENGGPVEGIREGQQIERPGHRTWRLKS